MAKTIKKDVNITLLADYTDGKYQTNYDEVKQFLLDEVSNNKAMRITYIDKNDCTHSNRIFVNNDILGIFEGKSRKHGFRLHLIDIKKVVSLEYPFVDNLSAVDKVVANIDKVKSLFAKKRHPNLWQDLQKNYDTFDTNEYKKFYDRAEDKQSYNTKERQALYDYESQKSIHLLHDYYKTTTIKSYKPTSRNGGSGYEQYEACVANIKKHLDNKEDFNYRWHGNYDITVNGKLAPDGSYRAWLSTEYRDCGNGHYYLLIGENTAIFAEDD